MALAVIVVKSGGAAAVPDWQRHFAALLPRFRVVGWDDAGAAPEAVTHAVVWAPEPGRLAKFPNLKLILSSGAGVDHLADPALPKHVPVVRMGAPEAVARMAEHVTLSVLYHHRNWHRFADQQRRRVWAECDNPEAPARRVGIMGLGQLGTGAALAVAKFGFQVAGWSRTPKALPGIQCFAGPRGLAPFLKRTDILVCVLPATPETDRIINAVNLALLPRGATVINAARGSLVHEADLLAALDSGHITGAALDVFETEPLPEASPFWTHPLVTITPHVASFPGRAARAKFCAGVIEAHARGENLPNLFDAARGY
jgi:glyoxylate/hydroxypyruvate reductase A